MATPLFISLSEKLKHRIADEANAHDEDWTLPTLRELAKEYRTSLLTAKKAVEVLTLEGLTHARPGVGIKVNYKFLKEKGLHLPGFKIGVIFLDVFERDDVVLADTIRGIVACQRSLGFQFNLTAIPSSQSLPRQISVLENIVQQGVDGLIVASRMPLGLIAWIQEQKIKFVWANNSIRHEDIHCVMFDKSAMFLKLVGRIKELGFNKAAFIAPVMSQEDCNLFINLCASAGISLKAFGYDIIKKSEEFRQIARADALKILSSPDKLEIIICDGEIVTTGVLGAIFSKALRVPDDIHVLAISEQDNFQDRTPVPIDMLVYSFYELSCEVTRMLHDMLDGKMPASTIKYLQVGELKSTASLMHKADESHG